MILVASSPPIWTSQWTIFLPRHAAVSTTGCAGAGATVKGHLEASFNKKLGSDLKVFILLLVLVQAGVREHGFGMDRSGFLTPMVTVWSRSLSSQVLSFSFSSIMVWSCSPDVLHSFLL